MTRIRNLEEAEELMQPFERIQRRAKKENAKITKATEALVETLTDQNKTLSEQNHFLSRLFREAYRRLPDSARQEIDALKATWNLDNLEVHP